MIGRYVTCKKKIVQIFPSVEINRFGPCHQGTVTWQNACDKDTKKPQQNTKKSVFSEPASEHLVCTTKFFIKMITKKRSVNCMNSNGNDSMHSIIIEVNIVYSQMLRCYMSNKLT